MSPTTSDPLPLLVGCLYSSKNCYLCLFSTCYLCYYSIHIARPCGVTARLCCPDGCGGRHICRPYQPTRKIIITVKPRAGRAPPLPRYFYCPVGRGDPTPPRNFAAGTGCSTPQQLSIKSAPRAGVRQWHPGEADGSLPRANQSPTGALVAHCGAPPCSTPQQLGIKSTPRAGVRRGHPGNADGSLPRPRKQPTGLICAPLRRGRAVRLLSSSA